MWDFTVPPGLFMLNSFKIKSTWRIACQNDAEKTIDDIVGARRLII